MTSGAEGCRPGVLRWIVESTGRPPFLERTVSLAHAVTTPGGAPGPPGAAFAPGELVDGRYQVVRFLAAGGMGEVYEVLDRLLGERVALKTLRATLAASAEAAERFRREIQLARRVTHPNVCRILDVGVHGDAAYLTMELLEGESLADRIHRGRMTPAEALPLVRQMVLALGAAHDAGIVHRDFKSHNVMLLPQRVVVTDFGLARALGAEPSTEAGSVAAALLGSPAYMAPEQVEGTAVSPRTDVYALGVVLFEMVTAGLPFVGETPMQTAVMRLRQPPPSPRSLVRDLDPRWEAVILRCLKLEPALRYASPAEVLEALGARGARRGARQLLALALLALAGALAWRALPGAAPQTQPPAAPVHATDVQVRTALASLVTLPSEPGNACAEYCKLTALGGAPLPVPEPGVLFSRAKEPSPRELEMLRRLAADPAERRALEVFRTGARRATCQILGAVYPWSDDVNPFNQPMPNYRALLRHTGVARFLALELDRQGQHDEAVRWLEALVIVGWHLQDEPVALPNLLGMGISADAAELLSDLAARAGQPDRSTRWRAFAGLVRWRRFEGWTDAISGLIKPAVLATDAGIERLAELMETTTLVKGARAEAMMWVALAHLFRPGAPEPSPRQRALLERWAQHEEPVLAEFARRLHRIFALAPPERAALATRVIEQGNNSNYPR